MREFEMNVSRTPAVGMRAQSLTYHESVASSPIKCPKTRVLAESRLSSR